MKIFVTGGTGFVGQAVLAALGEAGHLARVLVRDPASPRACELALRLGTETVAGDVLDPASLQRALPGCDAVIHLVGIISEVGRNTFENAHTVATRNVVAAAQAVGVSRYVHMSALGTRPNAASRYHQTKWAAEEIVRASGLAWTLFRPSLIHGPGDHFTRLFAALARWSPALPVMGDGQGLLQPVAVEAVALAFARALTEPAAVGRVFDLCGPERLSFNQVLDAILAVTDRRRLKLHVPLPLARLQARFLEGIFPRLLGRAAPLNRDQLLMLQEDNVGDPRPANELFRLPVESFRDGLARCLKRG
jgi:NADH dehydrogenase